MSSTSVAPEAVYTETENVRISTDPTRVPWYRSNCHLALRWNPADPLAVCLIVEPHGSPRVEWHCARELLVDGGGVGHLHVARGGVRTTFTLSNKTGYAQLQVFDPWVQAFVEQTLAVTPLGNEPDGRAELDALLHRWTRRR